MSQLVCGAAPIFHGRLHKIVTQERKFRNCDCCSEPFGTPIAIEYVSVTKECETDTCGYQDPDKEACDKTYYRQKVTVNTYTGGVETVTQNAARNEEGSCISTTVVNCVPNDPNDPFPQLACAGTYTSVTTFSDPITSPVISGISVGNLYDPCGDVEIGSNYPPYRYIDSNFDWKTDLCLTQDWPYYDESGYHSTQNGQNFHNAAVSYNLLSNLCPFAFEAYKRLTNVKFRLRHYATATCYLKVWLRVRKQSQTLVQRSGFPCCYDLVDDGPPTEEIVEYVWQGSGRPCYQFDDKLYTDCSNVVYSPNYFLELEEDENAVKTVGILKWSYLPDYEPNTPDEFGDQGEKTNGFPLRQL